VDAEKRKHGVSVWTATGLVIANMIGTGVFTSLGFQAAGIRSPFALMLLWIIGGLFAFCGALAYSELAAALPRSGGEFNFLSRIYHPAVGFLAGWVSVTVGFAAPIALASMAFGTYLTRACPGIAGLPLSCAVATLVALMHAWRLRVGSVFQNSVTALKIALIVVFAGAGLLLKPVSFSLFLPRHGDLAQVATTPFAVSLIYVMYAYSGWNAASYIMGEVRDARRNVPRAMFAGTLIVTVLYVVLNAVFLLAAPLDELAGKLDVAAVAAGHIFGETGGRIVSGLVCVALVSCISAMTWAGPRIAQVMGEDHRTLHWLSWKTSHGIPLAAIALQWGVVMALLLTEAFEKVLVYAQFTLNLCAFLTVAGVIRLRRTAPNLERPYHMFAYPISAILFLIISLATLVFTLREKPFESVAGFGTVLCGLLFYRPKKIAVTAAVVLALLCVPTFAAKKMQDGTQILRALPVYDNSPDDTNTAARLLAGIEPGGSGPAARLAATPVWKNYAHDMDYAWLRLELGRMGKIRAWSQSEMGRVARPVVFYPFSGPDFTYVFAYLPDATTYVLCGLEPVGNVPAVERIQNPGGTFNVLRQSLSTLTNAGYFVTKSMRVELNVGELQGTLPLLFIQLARAGCRITSVEAGGSRVKIGFDAPTGPRNRTLYYFSTDLSNGPLGGNKGFNDYLRSLAPVTTYVKSASYLMHSNDFSRVRDLILGMSGSVVQDDSGIPLRYFDPKRWQLRFYGNYTGPLEIFKQYYQADLAAAYQSVRNRSPLDFGVGYKWQPDEACLIVATVK
jgi:APA family basic amino acid/polyamine antiporter